ncbi:MAG TPA: T9SS type A sorting domain-containing protein [Candidatus Eisenbacteria bacterium]
MSLHTRINRAAPFLAVFAAVSFASSSLAAEKTVVKPMSDIVTVTTPLTYTPGRGTPAVAETTIRHQVFFDDLEGSTAGWGAVDFRQGQPVAWHIVSGTQSCVGSAWWCGQTGLPHGDGYPNNWVQTLTTNVPITLNGTNNNNLTFKYRARSELYFDWGWVLIKGGNAGARWDTLASYSGDFGTSCNSASVSIPDSFTTVTQPVTLMFLFGSDLSISAEDSTGAYTGWSVDDVKITAQGNNVRFFDDMEAGSSKWIAASPDPGSLWHLETAPGTSIPASCFFLSTNVFVPFQGSYFGQVPDFVDAMLTTPPMDLSGVFSPNNSTTSLRLQFDDWVNLPFDNAVYWSLWISGSNDLTTWTPWRNALSTLVLYVDIPQCVEGSTLSFDPYATVKTGVQPGTKYIRLGFRLRDEKASSGDPGAVNLGLRTEGIYFDDVGVYSIYTISGVENVDGAPAGTRVSIRRIFPNPFNPSTTIEFSVPKSGPVAVRIFDLQGRRITTLVEDSMAAGVYRVKWNGKTSEGRDLASGIYFAQIEGGGSRQSARLTMLK